MDAVGKLYKLAEKLGDDLYVVAFCVKQYRPYAPPIDEIARRFADAEPDEFLTVLDQLLDLTPEQLELVAANPTFKDDKSYVAYLQGLLDIHGVFYVPFIREGRKDAKEVRSLFNCC